MLTIGMRVHVHVEPNHGGIDYGMGTVVAIEHATLRVPERAIVALDSGWTTGFNTRWVREDPVAVQQRRNVAFDRFTHGEDC